jgi:hypothetical protein
VLDGDERDEADTEPDHGGGGDGGVRADGGDRRGDVRGGEVLVDEPPRTGGLLAHEPRLVSELAHRDGARTGQRVVGSGHDDVLVAGDDRPVQRAILRRASADADVGAA